LDINSQKREHSIRKILKESNDFHDIFTPFELCNEIIGKVHTRLTPTKDTKYLVIANLEFVVTLKEFLKSCNIGVDNVTFATPCPMKERVALALGVNVIKYNYNKLDESFRDMPKFDCVIGNPPWKEPNKTGSGIKALDQKFYKKFWRDAPVSVCILSSSFLTTQNPFAKLVLNDLSVCELINTTAHFDVATGSLAILRNENFNSSQITIGMGTFNRRDIICLPNEASLLHLVTKIVGDRKNSLSEIFYCGGVGLLAKSLVMSGKFAYINVIGRDTSSYGPVIKYRDDFTAQPCWDNWKVVFNANGTTGVNGIGGTKIAPPNVLASHSVAVLYVPTEKQALNIQQYLSSNIIKFLTSMLKVSNYNSRGFFDLLPMVDPRKTYTNDQLYQHFNLTEEEITLIEETIK